MMSEIEKAIQESLNKRKFEERRNHERRLSDTTQQSKLLELEVYLESLSHRSGFYEEVDHMLRIIRRR